MRDPTSKNKVEEPMRMIPDLYPWSGHAFKPTRMCTHTSKTMHADIHTKTENRKKKSLLVFLGASTLTSGNMQCSMDAENAAWA